MKFVEKNEGGSVGWGVAAGSGKSAGRACWPSPPPPGGAAGRLGGGSGQQLAPHFFRRPLPAKYLAA